MSIDVYKSEFGEEIDFENFRRISTAPSLRELAFLLAKMTEGVIISTKTPPVKSSAFDSPLGDGAVVVLSYFSPTNSNY